MTRILAIDPGTRRSAYVFLDGDLPTAFEILDNETLLGELRRGGLLADELVIEQVQHYGTGMPVGVEIFETVFWSGRFAEAAHPMPVGRIGRKPVVMHICGSARAKDSNVRQALIDRFGGESAIGRKGSMGPLYGIANDVWQALAVAVAWSEGARNPEPKVKR